MWELQQCYESNLLTFYIVVPPLALPYPSSSVCLSLECVHFLGGPTHSLFFLNILPFFSKSGQQDLTCL